jgi:hypothetical protein
LAIIIKTKKYKGFKMFSSKIDTSDLSEISKTPSGGIVYYDSDKDITIVEYRENKEFILKEYLILITFLVDLKNVNILGLKIYQNILKT